MAEMLLFLAIAIALVWFDWYMSPRNIAKREARRRNQAHPVRKGAR